MKKIILVTLVILLVSTFVFAACARPGPDQIFINGKVLTVDENFSIVQAFAITGERIAAVGTNEEILSLQGANTEVTDLGGKTVIPGLIDNHQHFTRAIMTWRWEVRFDGVNTRARAVEMIKEKVAASEPLDWVVNIGGWSLTQFIDSQEPFTLEELDRLAPNNPVYIASGRGGGYCNTLALETIGWRNPETRPPLGWIPVEQGEIGVPATVRANLPRYVGDTWKAEWLPPIFEDYNRAGLTTVWSSNGGSADHWLRHNYQQWLYENVVENGGWTNLRVIHDDMSAIQFTIKGYSGLRPPTGLRFDPEVVFQDWPEEWTTPGGTGDYFRVQGNQEALYGPVYRWPPEDVPNYQEMMTDYRIMLDALVERGGQVNEHTMGPPKFEYMLDFFEDMVQTGTDMRDLRWSFHHTDNMVREEMERAKELGMFLSIHVAHAIKGPRGGRPLQVDRFSPRTAQEVGIRWGLGSDSGIVAPYRPFVILSVVITGKDIPGNQMLVNQTVSREEALIAYTRSNAWRLYMEDDIGSIEPGKYADIVVLDRDYMTVPDEEIRDIESVLTLVGGRVGYSASDVRPGYVPFGPASTAAPTVKPTSPPAPGAGPPPGAPPGGGPAFNRPPSPSTSPPPAPGAALDWSDMPLYAGAEETEQGSWVMPPPPPGAAWSQEEVRFYTSGDSASDVSGFYQTALTDSGWQEVMRRPGLFGLEVIALYNKDGGNHGAEVIIDTYESKTLVVLKRQIK